MRRIAIALMLLTLLLLLSLTREALFKAVIDFRLNIHRFSLTMRFWDQVHNTQHHSIESTLVTAFQRRNPTGNM